MSCSTTILVSAEGDRFAVESSQVAASELLTDLLRCEGEDPVLVPLPSTLLRRALTFLRMSAGKPPSSLPKVSRFRCWMSSPPTALAANPLAGRPLGPAR